MEPTVVTTFGRERDVGTKEYSEMKTVREGLRVKIDPIPGLTKRGIIPRLGFHFQCPPLEEFTVEYAHSHTDYETIRLGQMSQPGGKQLITVTFDTLVVDYATWTVVESEIEAESFRRRLKRVCESGTPFLFTAAHEFPPGGFQNWSVTEAGPELQMAATLRTFRSTEKAGEGDARYFNVAFVEYRDPVIARRRLGKPGRSNDKVKLPLTGKILDNGFFRYRTPDGDTITLRSEIRTAGDRVPYGVTMSDLAKHFYGDPSKAYRIAAENNLNTWGATSILALHPRFKKRGPKKLLIPKIRKPKPAGESGGGAEFGFDAGEWSEEALPGEG
jgi:hypothetical protein